MEKLESTDVCRERIRLLGEDTINSNGRREKFVSEIVSAKQSPYPDSQRPDMLKFVPITAETVLDVGCHMGGFGYAIKKRSGAEVWGIEPHPKTANVARQCLDHVINGIFSSDLPIPDSYFDVVTFTDVLEHMVDPWSALKLASQKLKPDGCVVVSLPNLRHIQNLLHIINEADFRYEDEGIRDRTHLRFFTKKSALRLFDESGLQVMRIEGINEDWWRPSILRRLAFRFFREKLEDTRFIQYAIVAKKR
jgi:2-polyprenyl-3-methyl-5-hydroxy-6-metoxy-1,4-benzoquinol methylase